jgi:hypothetical protein
MELGLIAPAPVSDVRANQREGEMARLFVVLALLAMMAGSVSSSYAGPACDPNPCPSPK